MGSKYMLVMLSAKRAMQLVENFNAARKGEMPKYKPPQVEFFGKTPLAIALEEILQERITLSQAEEKS
jgi:DNA-directed RNA polymerase omega subunit